MQPVCVCEFNFGFLLFQELLLILCTKLILNYDNVAVCSVHTGGATDSHLMTMFLSLLLCGVCRLYVADKGGNLMLIFLRFVCNSAADKLYVSKHHSRIN